MKYDGSDLNKLAEEAKRNLINSVNKEIKESHQVAQIKANGNIENKTFETEDLYKEFREDGIDTYTENNSTEDENEKINIYSSPNYDDNEDYNIRTNPSEEELEDNPMIEEYEEPIFEGGPTTGQVLMWKKQWADYDILATDIADKTFIFRTLNRFEYKQIVALKNIDAMRREEIICETANLWPQPYDWKTMATDKAGIPSTYSKIIMQKSGFTQEYKIQVL